MRLLKSKSCVTSYNIFLHYFPPTTLLQKEQNNLHHQAATIMEAEAETTPNTLLRYTVSGGSRALISRVVERPKKVTNHADRMVRAEESAIKRLGLREVSRLRSSFDSLNAEASTKHAADGMIQAMLDLKFSSTMSVLAAKAWRRCALCGSTFT